VTLIVGILCADGVVLVADGAATLGAPGQPTIRQPVKKLEILAGPCVLGVSGPVGLGQRFRGELEDVLRPARPESLSKYVHEAMLSLRKRFWKHVSVEMEVAEKASRLIGRDASSSALSTVVVATVISNEHVLIQFDQQCAPELASPNIPFISIGSGQQTADPFLALLRRLYWPSGLPLVVDGLFAACWTVMHVIETTPGGVAEPMQAVVLQKVGGKWSATELSPDQLEEHRQHASEAEEYMRAFRRGLQPGGKATADIPLPAKPAQ